MQLNVFIVDVANMEIICNDKITDKGVYYYPSREGLSYIDIPVIRCFPHWPENGNTQEMGKKITIEMEWRMEFLDNGEWIERIGTNLGKNKQERVYLDGFNYFKYRAVVGVERVEIDAI